MQLAEIREDQLPATYQSARRALAECVRIDEVKDWSDKAFALAVYAKQANDDKLLVMSNRIKARAVLRMGELFNEMESAQGARKDLTSFPQRQEVGKENAAKNAGISHRQLYQAQRIANLPRDEVDELIESDNPPTISAFDQMARAHPQEMRATSSLLGEAKSFAKFCSSHDAKSLVVALAPHERAALMQHATIIVNWLTEIAGEL